LVVKLPQKFLSWNYVGRRESAKAFIEGRHGQDMSLFFLESTRHNPALCTAFQKPDGAVFVNAKIVGAGYVLKSEYLPEATRAFHQHLEFGDSLFSTAKTSKEKKEATEKYQRNSMQTLLEHLYLEPEEARRRVDFTKMSTIELAKSKPYSSKHTWKIVQKNRTACLLFYRPPNLSFELRGWLDIHESGLYYDFVNAVHDAFHYSPPEKRQIERPVYIFNMEEVYDNSPTRGAFGTKIV